MWNLVSKYEFNESQLKNILFFLDRVEYKGLAEIQAINEIINVFNCPAEEQSNKD